MPGRVLLETLLFAMAPAEAVCLKVHLALYWLQRLPQWRLQCLQQLTDGLAIVVRRATRSRRNLGLAEIDAVGGDIVVEGRHETFAGCGRDWFAAFAPR